MNLFSLNAFTVFLAMAHGELSRCWRGAGFAVMAGIDTMLARQGRVVCQRQWRALSGEPPLDARGPVASPPSVG